MNRRGLIGISLLMTLLPVALPVAADTAAEPVNYTYSEDWAVVSAPPPPGPYRAVNLDPRIPGQDMLPLLPVTAQPTTVATEVPAVDMPAEVLESQPPAAGIPVMLESEASPAAALEHREAVLPPRIQGHYNRNVPAYNYPSPPRYPDRTGYPGYRNMPPMGYNGMPVPHFPQQGFSQQGFPQQVPPPPVYDAMMNKRQSFRNQGAEGTYNPGGR